MTFVSGGGKTAVSGWTNRYSAYRWNWGMPRGDGPRYALYGQMVYVRTKILNAERQRPHLFLASESDGLSARGLEVGDDPVADGGTTLRRDVRVDHNESVRLPRIRSEVNCRRRGRLCPIPSQLALLGSFNIAEKRNAPVWFKTLPSVTFVELYLTAR